MLGSKHIFEHIFVVKSKDVFSIPSEGGCSSQRLARLVVSQTMWVPAFEDWKNNMCFDILSAISGPKFKIKLLESAAS